jgi:hypothetical protein
MEMSHLVGLEVAISRILFSGACAPERQSSIYDAGCPAPLAANPEVYRRAACG